MTDTVKAEEKRGPGRPPKVELFPVILKKNYTPMGDYEIEVMVAAPGEEFTRPQWQKPDFGAVGKDGNPVNHKGERLRKPRVEAGRRIRVPKGEARRAIELDIAERGDDL